MAKTIEAGVWTFTDIPIDSNEESVPVSDKLDDDVYEICTLNPIQSTQSNLTPNLENNIVIYVFNAEVNFKETLKRADQYE